jgi:hypothetical protein
MTVPWCYFLVLFIFVISRAGQRSIQVVLVVRNGGGVVMVALVSMVHGDDAWC